MSIPPQTRVAAFFDLDRTLIAFPSLEWRFFLWLRRERLIPARNYWAWLARAVTLAPHGLAAIRHSNKAYLRGISSGELKTFNRHVSRIPVPCFLPLAIQRLFWHVERRHAIFLVTGTLEPLASEIAQAIAVLLALRGSSTSLGVVATCLQEHQNRWTGRVEGQPICGASKARAVLRIAAELHLDLPRCYAYGDSLSDSAMLELVGHPAAVNPSLRLRRLATKRLWPILAWPSTPRSLASAEPAAQPCRSGPIFEPDAFPQHQQDSSFVKAQ